MSNSNKSKRTVRQNDKILLKSQKHDANLQKNSTLYFQIGLIVCLLVSYTALETVFATAGDYVYKTPTELTNDLFDIVPDNYVVEKPKPEQKPELINQKPKPLNEIKIVDNDFEVNDALIETFVDTPKPNKGSSELNPDDLKVDPLPTIVNIMAVQNVPVYPGCEREKTNDARRKCMSDKLGKLVQKKFNTDLGSEYGLSGLQKIDVYFKINKQGEVVLLNTRAPHPALDKEAKRIVEEIPTMEPGMNNKQAVEVSYNLPIKFNVQN